MGALVWLSEKRPTEILMYLDKMLSELEALYKDIHAHPELSMLQTRAAGIATDHLKTGGLEVTTGMGKTEAFGILRNVARGHGCVAYDLTV